MTAMKQSDLAVDCVLDWNQARWGPANLALLKMTFEANRISASKLIS